MPKSLTFAGPHYDIVIVGGGMVGISLALLLAKQKNAEGQSWKVLLIEAQSLQGREPGACKASFDARSTALSWSSHNIFESLGLWSELKRSVSAITQIHVSDRGHVGLTRINAEDVDVKALGYVVENHWMGSILLNQLAATDVEIMSSTKIDAITPLMSGMQLTLEGTGQIIQASLLVVADGLGSSTALKLGIMPKSSAYGQTGIIANITLEKPHGGVAYERFTDHGPMALLPLTDFQGQPRSALVWTQPDDLAATLMAVDDAIFLQALQDRFGYRLGRFEQVGERVSYPLTLTTSSEQVRRHLVVIGNAAHALHPVAGQGFNLSLRDAATLASCLQLELGGINVGALKTLQGYQQRQATDQANTLLFSDSLPKLFGQSVSVVALGRNCGLVAMDLLPGLRGRFARFGMGMATREAGHG
jgi:2-octaprenyl-6-methoxyphenol hydroxylase